MIPYNPARVTTGSPSQATGGRNRFARTEDDMTDEQRKQVADRITSRVKKKAGCWLAPGVQLSVGGRRMSYRRASVEAFTGRDPGRSYLFPSCGNPRCVNPKHLIGIRTGDV